MCYALLRSTSDLRECPSHMSFLKSGWVRAEPCLSTETGVSIGRRVWRRYHEAVLNAAFFSRCDAS